MKKSQYEYQQEAKKEAEKDLEKAKELERIKNQSYGSNKKISS